MSLHLKTKIFLFFKLKQGHMYHINNKAPVYSYYFYRYDGPICLLSLFTIFYFLYLIVKTAPFNLTNLSSIFRCLQFLSCLCFFVCLFHLVFFSITIFRWSNLYIIRQRLYKLNYRWSLNCCGFIGLVVFQQSYSHE